MSRDPIAVRGSSALMASCSPEHGTVPNDHRSDANTIDAHLVLLFLSCLLGGSLLLLGRHGLKRPW